MQYTKNEAKAWAKENILGFWDAPITPFTEDGRIDEEGVRHNVEMQIEAGVDGLAIGGFVAEAWNLKLSDWFRYHQIYAEAVKGRVELATIILDPSVHQALEKMAFCEKIGINSAEVMNPSVQLKTDDEIFSFYKYISDHSDMAIVLYRSPVSGTVLSMDLMHRLADLETLVGVKQSSLKRGDTLKLRRDVRKDFGIYEPFECFWYDDLRMGYPVVSWAGLSYTLYGKRRQEIREYIRLAEASEWEASWRVFQGLRPLYQYFDDVVVDYIARTASYASGLTIFKPWYDAIGMKGGHVLPPVQPVAPEVAAEVKAKLAELGVC